MAQTVQKGGKGAAAGSKRGHAPEGSDPASPAKKSKTATARKSTGGRAPKKGTGSEGGAGARMSTALRGVLACG